jgi:phage terminase small subunit
MTTLPPRAPLRAHRLNRTKAERPLTLRQRRFVDEYLVDMNASAAARRAGYGDRSADRHGSFLTRRPNVAAAIEARLAERRARLEVSAARVITELARIAFADLGRILDWTGEDMALKPPHEISPDDRAAIQEIAVVKREGGLATRVILHDKERALEALCRHLGLFQPGAIAVEPPKYSEELRQKLREMIDRKVAERLAEAREADRRAAEAEAQREATESPES